MVANFLKEELKLELSLDKTKITDLHHDKAKFLGFYLQINKPQENQRTTINFKGTTNKIGHPPPLPLSPPLSRGGLGRGRDIT